MSNAKICFSENWNEFKNPNGTSKDFEKFNLYSGLYDIAETIEELKAEIQELKQIVCNLSNKIN